MEDSASMTTLPKSDIEAILSSKLGDRKFEIVSCEKKNVDDISIGFLSSVGKATIHYKVQDVIENFSIFIKRLPNKPSHREEVSSMGGFDREVIVFNSFLNNINLDVDYAWPTCYLARLDEVIVLEDLSEKGFKNQGIFGRFDLDHCLRVVDSIAKLHAFSIIFEKQEGKTLNEIIYGLEKEIVFSNEDNHVGKKRHLVGVKAMKRFSEIHTTKYTNEIIDKAFDYLTDMPAHLHASEKYPNVFSHNDLWSNNIMFSYDREGKVSKACLIDFQCATYRPPSFDVQLMIYCCTDREMRRKHIEEIKEYYFEQLQVLLKEGGIEIETSISREMFENMWEDTLASAIGLCAQFMLFVGIPEHLLKPIMEDDSKWKNYYQVDRDEVVLQACLGSSEYRNKILECLQDLFDHFSK